ncbi:MAG: xylulokinase [Synergistes sp.]|nr:xylulokinase [Synergistes sp.]
MYYIGIDLGTSAVKLVLMDEQGRVVKITSREYPLFFPKPGWSEQRPEDWWSRTLDGLQELSEGIPRTQIRGISFGGQMHGLVILDEDDKVIRPAILWNDGRTQEETDYLNDVIGKDELIRMTGNIAFAGFTAPKILWLKKNEPDNFARIRKIMLPKDYLAYRMTGVHSSDYSDASGTLMMDVRGKCWSDEMLQICGVDKAWMPELFESYEMTGTLLPEVAEVLDFPKDVIVAAGAGDNAAAAVGTGTVGPGKCNLSLGTSGTIFLTNSEYVADPRGVMHSFAHADGAYHLMGCMLSAASCNNWWMNDILRTGDFAKEQEEIGALGENHVYFLPYLMGERSPHNDAAARGAFVGMSMDTTRADMLQAVFEGVAFGLRDSLESARKMGIHPERATICGGGAKSPLWRKIIANIMNIKVDVPAVEEGPGYGAAILAAVADGCYTDVVSACSAIIRTTETEDVSPALAARYQERYETFIRMYPALKDIYKAL